MAARKRTDPPKNRTGRVRELAGEALELVRRFERTSGLSRAIRRPGIAPEWWRDTLREAQADFWDHARNQPDRQRHILVSRALSALASGESAQELKAPSTAAALERWAGSSPDRLAYVEVAARLGEQPLPSGAPTTDALKAGYAYELREVGWILEEALRDVADLPADDPRLRRRDPSDEAAERTRQIRRALHGEVSGSRAGGQSKKSLKLVG